MAGGSSGAIGIGAQDEHHHEEPRRLSHNELEMARQFSEASVRISVALEREKRGRKKGDGTEDLKQELEMVSSIIWFFNVLFCWVLGMYGLLMLLCFLFDLFSGSIKCRHRNWPRDWVRT